MKKIYNFVLLLQTVKNIPIVLGIYLKKIKSSTQPIYLWSNQTLFVRANSNDIHEIIAVSSGREYPFALYKKHISKKHAVIVNIGSHIGTFELYIRSKGNGAQFYSLEPDEDNYKLLSKNIKANHLSNITTFRTACTNKNGMIRISNQKYEKNSIHMVKNGGIQVKSITLDNLVKTNNIKYISLLKLDCEGSEYEILRSMKCWNITKSCIMEYHISNQAVHDTKESIIDLFIMHGFSLRYEKSHYSHDKNGILFFEKQQ